MKKKLRSGTGIADVVFLPALSPLEASVLPAVEKRAYGVLSMIRRAYDEREEAPSQRTKICVRYT